MNGNVLLFQKYYQKLYEITSLLSAAVLNCGTCSPSNNYWWSLWGCFWLLYGEVLYW